MALNSRILRLFAVSEWKWKEHDVSKLIARFKQHSVPYTPIQSPFHGKQGQQSVVMKTVRA